MLKIRARARDDILDIISRIALDNPAAARSFAGALRLQLLLIQRIPGGGARLQRASNRLAGLRQWPIRGFRQYLVFYIPHGDEIDVIRVLHSARNVGNILAGE